ncbi:MAG: DegT/DnrJ/EryC1/StrS family aminotransferase, partial [Gemmatales bacterium]|nr:DegT/DnrJ/EryC1/StrS family aminotransferase [Gemmatales bacterium]MDW8174132.1 DegT/DnrJ/EryC1/StrS family aminotransferase [Gemmatales bacterium]
EDCCQAHGARVSRRHVGTFGHAGVFSFYPGKNLGTCGEGGAIITNDTGLAERCRQLRDHGQIRRYHHAKLGYNYRMPTMQAAVLLAKLPYLDDWNTQRRRAAAFYAKALGDLPLWTPPYSDEDGHVWHLYTVRTPRRSELALWLNAQGSAYGLHYPLPLHLQPAYRHLGYRPRDLPVAERIARETCTLPLFPEITQTQQKKVIRALYGFFGREYDELLEKH